LSRCAAFVLAVAGDGPDVHLDVDTSGMTLVFTPPWHMLGEKVVCV